MVVYWGLIRIVQIYLILNAPKFDVFNNTPSHIMLTYLTIGRNHLPNLGQVFVIFLTIIIKNLLSVKTYVA